MRSPPSATRYQVTGPNTIAIRMPHQCAAARDLGPSSKSANGSSSTGGTASPVPPVAIVVVCGSAGASDVPAAAVPAAAPAPVAAPATPAPAAVPDPPSASWVG